MAGKKCSHYFSRQKVTSMKKTSHTLNEEIPCTMMPPHFYGVIDKGTVNRRTSQAAYSIFQNNGRRCAYPLGAPLVYKRTTDSYSSDSDSDDGKSLSDEDSLPDVDGGSAGDLARNLLNTMKIKLKLEGPDLSRYCGTTADGQYQAEDFLATIHKETCREEIPQDLLFCQTTIWDASHLLNLASTDIKEGKCGNSQTFFNKFIKRANEFNHLLSKGKGYAQLEISAQGKKKNAVVVTPFVAQCFLSSAINQWKTIEKGFSVLHAAFYTVHSGADEDFPLQYRVFGQDFVSDHLGLLDVTAPLSELMILSQAIDFLHWKIVFWGEQMVLWMEDILDNIRELPRFKRHLAEIENFQFQGVKILEGWELVNREEIERPEDGANIVYNWEERTVDE